MPVYPGVTGLVGDKSALRTQHFVRTKVDCEQTDLPTKAAIGEDWIATPIG